MFFFILFLSVRTLHLPASGWNWDSWRARRDRVQRGQGRSPPRHICTCTIDINVNTPSDQPLSPHQPHAASNTHIQSYAAFCCRTVPLQNDLARCVLSRLWKFLCKRFSFVCVCKQNLTLRASENRVVPRDNRNTEQSHACLMSASLEKKSVFFCFWMLSDCLS